MRPAYCAISAHIIHQKFSHDARTLIIRAHADTVQRSLMLNARNWRISQFWMALKWRYLGQYDTNKGLYGFIQSFLAPEYPVRFCTGFFSAQLSCTVLYGISGSPKSLYTEEKRKKQLSGEGWKALLLRLNQSVGEKYSRLTASSRESWTSQAFFYFRTSRSISVRILCTHGRYTRWKKKSEKRFKRSWESAYENEYIYNCDYSVLNYFCN